MKTKSLLISVMALALMQGAPAEEAPPVLGILARQIAGSEDTAMQRNLLRGMNAALQGRRGVQAPPEWDAVVAKLAQSEDTEIRELLQSLGTIFGRGDAMASLRATLRDAGADAAARGRALDALVQGRDPQTAPILLELIQVPGPLRAAAIRALAAFDDAASTETLVKNYATFSPDERRDALHSLAARPASAAALLKAIEAKAIPAADISVALVRQLRSFNHEALHLSIDRHFGKLAGATDKQAEIAKIKEWLTPEWIKGGDPAHGRAVYQRSCAICHKLFDAGTDIGPELTGANRTDIDYWLQNIVDPNAMIGEDYQLNTIEMKDGRVLVGMVKGQDAATLTIRTLAEQVIVPAGEVKSKTINPMSMMPEGLLGVLSREETRDLFRYLASPEQVAERPAP
jgi:putative heme-binding domain-containing protein